MNPLQLQITRLNLSELAVMNALQGEAGIISDLCVNASDVAETDWVMACRWVEENQDRIQKHNVQTS